MNKSHIALLATLLFSACDLIEYHPYDVDVSGEKNVNAKNIARIEAACAGKQTVKFVMMGDSQRWYDETEDMVKHVNARQDIDFVIHGGDISDFGLTKEFIWVRDIMAHLRVPYVALIGNHDVIGHGSLVYKEIYGADNFAFTAGAYRFICMNTCALEYDYTHPVPDLNFMYGELDGMTPEIIRAVPVMHVPPGAYEFNNNVARVFHELIKRLPAADFCLHAHDHRLEERDLFDDGLIYYGSDCMAHRNYMVFTLTPEGYTHEVVYF